MLSTPWGHTNYAFPDAADNTCAHVSIVNFSRTSWILPPDTRTYFMMSPDTFLQSKRCRSWLLPGGEREWREWRVDKIIIYRVHPRLIVLPLSWLVHFTTMSSLPSGRLISLHLSCLSCNRHKSMNGRRGKWSRRKTIFLNLASLERRKRFTILYGIIAHPTQSAPPS